MRAQTTMRASLPHFHTFARLHEGTSADAPALRALAATLPPGPGGEQPVWPVLLEAAGAHVLVATECQLMVGAVVVWHRKDTREARLGWLGVALAARGRGVGRLLLDTAIGAVAAHRARSVVIRPPQEAERLVSLLRASGFAREKGGIMRLVLQVTAA